MSTIAAWIVCFCVDRFGHMVICACSRIEARMRMRAYMIWMDPQYQIQFYFSLSKISQIEQAIELYATKWPSSYAITHMCMCVCVRVWSTTLQIRSYQLGTGTKTRFWWYIISSNKNCCYFRRIIQTYFLSCHVLLVVKFTKTIKTRNMAREMFIRRDSKP